MKLILYNALPQYYTNTQYVTIVKGCNGWSARNVGDDVVRINGIPLLPRLIPGTSGEAMSIGGNLGEAYDGLIQIVFAGLTANPMVEIIQKYYLEEQNP